MKQSSITTKVIGVSVIETYEIGLDLNPEDQKRFDANPEETIRRLLIAAGHEVNRITLMKRAQQRENARPSDHWYHIVYPPNEKSGWFCCCVD